MKKQKENNDTSDTSEKKEKKVKELIRRKQLFLRRRIFSKFYSRKDEMKSFF